MRKKPKSKRQKMWQRIVVGPILILAGFWLMLQTSYHGLYPGVLDISILTSPIWLIGLVLGTTGLYMLARPLFRRGIL